MKNEAQEFKWVGKRPIRPDGVDKVTGRAKFGADMHLPGMLIGRVLRSPHAHARIRSIDTTKAVSLRVLKRSLQAAISHHHLHPYGKLLAKCQLISVIWLGM